MDKWIELTKLTASDDLVQKAVAVFDRVLSQPSELLDLWTESDELESWKSALTDLRARLGGK